jgi:DNA-binding transcriptional ArsR family regulator
LTRTMPSDLARLHHEVNDLKERIESMQSVLVKIREAGSDASLALIPRRRSELLEVVVSQAIEDIEEGLARNMVKRCDMREPCRATFATFLQKNAALLEQDTVREEIILTNQNELDRLKSTAPYDKCEKCLQEVSRLFGKQIRLMRSMRIYSTEADKSREISEMPEAKVVKEFVEPIASRQRLQMLKALSVEPKTFSSLSQATGLKGGNLLFHLQKLVDAELAAQRHDRGDYAITEKGLGVLTAISGVYQNFKV